MTHLYSLLRLSHPLCLSSNVCLSCLPFCFRMFACAFTLDMNHNRNAPFTKLDSHKYLSFTRKLITKSLTKIHQDPHWWWWIIIASRLHSNNMPQHVQQEELIINSMHDTASMSLLISSVTLPAKSLGTPIFSNDFSTVIPNLIKWCSMKMTYWIAQN